MMDLNNPNPDTMNYKVLSEIVASFKRFKKGKENIMRYSEKLYNDAINEGLNKGKIEGKIETLLALVKDGFLTLQQAAERMGMPLEKFEKEAKNLALL